jgi:SAM-dependent methyltransferase
MFTHTARLYDRLYGFKDYEGAAQKLDGVIQARAYASRSLLDVGCGTGRHLRSLKDRYEVSGLDLDANLIAVAREAAPEIPYHVADMTDFDIGRTFDVVTCLFSAIAYVETIDRVERAIVAMRRHLNPGGLLIVEPWFAPENHWEGRLTANFHDEPDLKISWMYINSRVEDVSVLDIHYTVGTPEGVEQFREVHRMGLFTQAQYLAAFEKAGFDVEHDADGLFQRGLYIGKLKA